MPTPPSSKAIKPTRFRNRVKLVSARPSEAFRSSTVSASMRYSLSCVSMLATSASTSRLSSKRKYILYSIRLPRCIQFRFAGRVASGMNTLGPASPCRQTLSGNGEQSARNLVGHITHADGIAGFDAKTAASWYHPPGRGWCRPGKASTALAGSVSRTP